MTCAAGSRLCPMCGEIVSATPPCPVCVGREAGAQVREEFAPEPWAPAGDARSAYEDEMIAAEGIGL